MFIIFVKIYLNHKMSISKNKKLRKSPIYNSISQIFSVILSFYFVISHDLTVHINGRLVRITKWLNCSMEEQYPSYKVIFKFLSYSDTFGLLSDFCYWTFILHIAHVFSIFYIFILCVDINI